jgi:hypothetical protein
MAARMIPSRAGTAFGTNLAEQDVFDALQRQLPDGSTVVYDYHYVAIDGNTFQDGQADFIAVLPGVGVCFVEVKGSHRFEYRDARWYRYEGSRPVEADDPFEQATRNKHRVINLLRDRLGWTSFPAAYGYLVVYPRGQLVGDQMPVAHPRALLVTRDQMGQLGERVAEAVRRAVPRPPAFGGRTVESVVEALTVGGVLVPVVAADVEAERSKIETLTADQHVAWAALVAGRRVVVIGPAGSGKTVLAVAKAEQLRRQLGPGGRVLLTCFNRRLAELIRLRDGFDTPWTTPGTPGLTTGVHVRHFHDVAKEYVKTVARRHADWDRLVAQHGEEAFFRDLVPVLMDEATDRLPDEWRFDAVVIDEGQDFHDLWLSKVQLLLRDPAHGPVTLCLGDGQRLFTADRQYLPNVDTTQVLRHNCRNTRLIARYASRVGQVPADSMPGVPTGEVPVLFPHRTTLTERVQLAGRIVQDWLAEGLTLSAVAILSHMGEDNAYGSLPGIRQFLAQPTTSEVGPWRAGAAVWTSTIRAFKGMEADCVVLVDVPKIGQKFTRDDLYVAVSRPRSRLVIVPATADAHQVLALSIHQI